MTADLELFLRGVGRFRHHHVFEAWDVPTLTWFCRCGAFRTRFDWDLRGNRC